jgi:hypothetical protein
MTYHQCPKCELRFNWKTEVDDHCWHDHPEFRHEYPAQTVPPAALEKPVPPAPRERRRLGANELWAWLQPASHKAAAVARQPADPDAPEPRHAAD